MTSNAKQYPLGLKPITNWVIKIFRIAAIIIGFCLPVTVNSAENSPFIIQDKEEFGKLVGNYLLENPEILYEIIQVLETREQLEHQKEEANLINSFQDEIFYDQHSFLDGDPNGEFLVAAFIDYRCGFCRQSHPVINQLLSDRDDIRLITKEFPILGEESIYLARIAIASLNLGGNQVYKDIQNQLFTLNGPPSEKFLEDLINQLNITPEEFRKEMFSQEVEGAIRSNWSLAENLNINATPTFIINDTILRGHFDYYEFIEIFENQG